MTNESQNRVRDALADLPAREKIARLYFYNAWIGEHGPEHWEAPDEEMEDRKERSFTIADMMLAALTTPPASDAAGVEETLSRQDWFKCEHAVSHLCMLGQDQSADAVEKAARIADGIAFQKHLSKLRAAAPTDPAQAPSRPVDAEGWKLVPVEPTEAMLDVYWRQAGESQEMRNRTHISARNRYYDLLAAAPTAPAQAPSRPVDAGGVEDERDARKAFDAWMGKENAGGFDHVKPMWLRVAAALATQAPDKARRPVGANGLLDTLEYIADLAEKPTYNSLEVGFRHSPLTASEEKHRLVECCEHIAQVARSALATTPTPPQADSTGQGDAIGPRTITTSRQTCEGCPSLALKDWSFEGENDDIDRGTSAKCSASAGKSITAYWSVLSTTPDWCPVLTPSQADAQTQEGGE